MQRVSLSLSTTHWYSLGAALIAVAMWSLAPLLADRAQAMSPIALTALTLLAGALASLPMSRKTCADTLPLRWKVLLWGGMPLLIVGAVSTYFLGMRHAPAAEAALITYTWPVLFVLLSQWSQLGRLRLAGLTGALIAFGGAAILMLPQALGTGSRLQAAGPGYALAVLAACCWALYSWVGQLAPIAIAALLPRLLLIACALATAASALFEGDTTLPDGATLLAGIALGLGPYGIAMVAWDTALRHGKSNLVGSLAYGVPILAALLLVLSGLSELDWRLPTAALLVIVGCLQAGR